METETSQTRQTQTATQTPVTKVQVPGAGLPEAGLPKDGPSEAQVSKRTQVFIIAGAVVFLILLIAAIVLMATFEQATQVIRDIAIVFVAVETFLIGLAMLLLIFQIQMLIQVLRDEIQPLLHSVNDTASTVRGTTEFVSQNVVSPVIKLAGFTAAVRRVTGNLVGIIGAMRPRSSSSQKPKGGNGDVV